MAEEARDIGVEVNPPDTTCEDKNCPFHGELSVRGQVLRGVVESVKMDGSAVVRKDYFNYVPKFERYEKKRSHYPSHIPGCIDVDEGDEVKIMKCRPLSKSVSFVIIERGEER